MDDRRAVVAVWASVAVLLLTVLVGPHDSLPAVIVPVIGAASLLCLVGALMSWRERSDAWPVSPQ